MQLATWTTAAWAADGDDGRALLPARPAQSEEARLQLRVDLQSLFHLRSDRDFDRSAPRYDESGQTVGAFATLLTPAVTLQVTEQLRLYYELELGLSYWSKQNPDQPDPQAPDVFVLKHRQIYGAGRLLDGRLGFKAGYAYFREPTGLFVAHWIGIAQLDYYFDGGRHLGRALDDRQRARVGLFVGQVPDQVHEGIILADNNFVRDIWLIGARGRLPLGEALSLEAALTALYDTHLVGQRRWLLAPTARLSLRHGRLEGLLDGALQGGQLEGQALDGGDQTHVAWAAQAALGYRGERLELRATALLLSPDDDHDGNRRSHAFRYSGKSASPTLRLTEDELRDWYDNLDERASRFSGGFLRNRAGLFVGDVRASWLALPGLRASVILGASTVLKPRNALDGLLVGLEGDLVLEARLTDYLLSHVVVGGLLPGQAGGALVNEIDRGATDPIGHVEASLLLRY